MRGTGLRAALCRHPFTLKDSVASPQVAASNPVVKASVKLSLSERPAPVTPLSPFSPQRRGLAILAGPLSPSLRLSLWVPPHKLHEPLGSRSGPRLCPAFLPFFVLFVLCLPRRFLTVAPGHGAGTSGAQRETHTQEVKEERLSPIRGT